SSGINAEYSSGFGTRADPFGRGAATHKGMDFHARVGDPVMAVAEGVVSFAGVKGGYGNVVDVDHGNGYVTRYAHNSRLVVKAGDLVRAGQEVAKAGSTGRSTGAHVHFEVWGERQRGQPAQVPRRRRQHAGRPHQPRLIPACLPAYFGSRNERQLRQLNRIVAKINALEPEIEKLSDEQLQAKTPEFKQRIAGGEALDKVLPEAFAVCREAGRRVLGMRHYDVQLIGGMVLHLGKIAEMRTGEGKTLVATLPVYLNALEGKGVHVVTVNDYLARRDAAQMGKLYNWLGLSVVCTRACRTATSAKPMPRTSPTHQQRFGFDYLRDNMALSKADRYQRGLHYAIVDEVDSILIDEARTPLIISGPADDSPELYIRVTRVVPNLVKQEVEDGEGDFWVDEKGKQVHLSEAGMEHAEQLLVDAGILNAETEGLYAPQT
ncbi:unnamed protein product, partial [Cylicocyclus nassatus]